MAGLIGGYDTNVEANQDKLRKVTVQRVGTRDFLDVAGDPCFTVAISYVAEGNGVGKMEYVGEAAPGSAKTDAVWRIKKITYDSNDKQTDVQWASGNDKWDKEWDERATYEYS